MPTHSAHLDSRAASALWLLTDLFAATRDPRNHTLYREQCELEVSSTFAFQANKWLCDVAPELLTASQLSRLPQAKIRAAKRQEIESRIPSHLLYVKGWPIAMPTPEEAALIAETRQRVAELMEIEVHHTTALSVSNRYADLIRLKEIKARTKKQRTPLAIPLMLQNTPRFLFVR